MLVSVKLKPVHREQRRVGLNSMNLFRALADWFYGLCVALVSAQREAEETERLGALRARLMKEGK
jgi:hypothetical protein